MTPYEEQTNDFRQVRRERRLPRSGDCVVEYRLQRRYLLWGEEIQGDGYRSQRGSEEWRNVPVVDEKDAL